MTPPGLSIMIEGQEGVSVDDWYAIAGACERFGFAGLFTADHYGSAFDQDGRGALDAWAVLAALASRTATLRLGTMVSPVTFRAPAVLAKLALTVDQFSAGRVEVGLGAGWHTREHAAFGFPFPPLGQRIGMLEEQTRIIRGLLDGDEVTFTGEHYQLDRCQMLPRAAQQRIPIILGGSALPRTARLAALLADEYNLVDEDPEGCRAARTRLDQACDAAGRDPATLPTSLMTRCVIGATDAEYRARLARVLDRAGEAPASVTDATRRRWIAGTPGQVLEQIAQFRAAGVSRFMLQHLDHTDCDALELLAETVAPRR